MSALLPGMQCALQCYKAEEHHAAVAYAPDAGWWQNGLWEKGLTRSMSVKQAIPVAVLQPYLKGTMQHVHELPILMTL